MYNYKRNVLCVIKEPRSGALEGLGRCRVSQMTKKMVLDNLPTDKIEDTDDPNKLREAGLTPQQIQNYLQWRVRQ